MKLKEKVSFHKAITTSREFFKDDTGIKCVHYGDIYKNYSGKKISSSNIINNFANPVSLEKTLYCDSIIVPDVTETVSDWGHFTYIEYDGTPYINGTHAIALTCDSKAELKYIFRYLSSDLNRKRLQAYLNGSTVFQINVKDFGIFNLDNYHNNPNEQQHIVDILGSIDDKIENLESKIKQILKLYSLKYKELISNCPYNATLDEIASIESGKRPPSKENNKTNFHNIPIIGASSVMGYTNKILYDEPILVIGRVGTHGIVQPIFEASWPSDNTLIIKSEFYSFVFNILCCIDYQGINKGSTQPLITQTDIKNTRICLPEINKLKAFEECCSLSIIKTYNDEIKKNNELKQLYLKKFFG